MYKCPIISIICITYNHVNFIRDAIEGFLKQKTRYSYEIIIHDDASDDGTADIILDYYYKYPDIIKPIIQKQNQHSKGVDIILEIIINHAKGKYLAFCEGDDFWSDPNKLENQVSFLENNIEFVGTAHRTLLIGEDRQPLYSKQSLSVNDFYAYCKERRFTLEHIQRGMMPGHLSSLIFKASLIKNLDIKILNKYKEWRTVGDRKISALTAAQGDYFCFDKIMSHYRYLPNNGKSWSSRQKNKNNTLPIFWGNIDTMNLINNNFNKSIKLNKKIFLCLYHAVVYFIKHPSLDNFKIIKDIFELQTYKVKAIITSMFYAIIFPFRKIESSIYFIKERKIINKYWKYYKNQSSWNE